MTVEERGVSFFHWGAPRRGDGARLEEREGEAYSIFLVVAHIFLV